MLSRPQGDTKIRKENIQQHQGAQLWVTSSVLLRIPGEHANQRLELVTRYGNSDNNAKPRDDIITPEREGTKVSAHHSVSLLIWMLSRSKSLSTASSPPQCPVDGTNDSPAKEQERPMECTPHYPTPGQTPGPYRPRKQLGPLPFDTISNKRPRRSSSIIPG